jgi:hypothetical protein
MFEKIFSYPAVLRRHREGPLASERLAYLKYLIDRGAALGTLLRQARYCLCVAHAIHRWPTWRKDRDLMNFLASL